MPLPLMPVSDSSVASAMPPGGVPSQPMLPPVGGDLASLIGGGPPSSTQPGSGDPLMNAASSALQQMDQIAQMVQDLARMFPGSEQFARDIAMDLDAWRQQILMVTTPPSTQMPGAPQMI